MPGRMSNGQTSAATVTGLSGPPMPPSLADIDALAQAAVERLPEQFRRWLGPVLLRVEDFPDAEVMVEMELETEFDILACIRGGTWQRRATCRRERCPTSSSFTDVRYSMSGVSRERAWKLW